MGLALIALSLGAGVLLAEVGLRLAWTNPFHAEPSDLLLELRLQHANRDLLVDRRQVYPDRPTARFRTDERGYIRPSRRFEAPDLTVAFLGGSTTECSALDEEFRFHAVVSRLLEERGLRVDVLNAARSGNALHDSLNVLLNHVVVDAPDVVVLMHVANDVGILARDPAYRSRMGHELTLGSFVGWALQEASARSSLVGAFRKWATIQAAQAGEFEHRANLERETAAIPPEPFVGRLRAFVRMARALGMEPVLMTEPAVTMDHALTPGWMSPRNQEIFNDEVRRVAAEEGAVLVDLARHVPTVAPRWREPMQVFYDGIHVTEEGARLYGEHIAERLLADVVPRVRERRAAPAFRPRP
jgi:lysophospholipase L1-like esterase